MCFLLSLIFNSLIPFIHFLFFDNAYSFNNSFSGAWIVSMTIFYPIIGYFIEHRLRFFNSSRNNNKLLLIWK